MAIDDGEVKSHGGRSGSGRQGSKDNGGPPLKTTDPFETDVPFRTIADYTYDWETWFGLSGKPLWINPAAERMTGYSVEECLAMSDYPLPIIHSEDREVISRILREALNGDSGNDHSFRIRRKDGGLCWAAVSWQPIHDGAGNSLGVRTSVRDITERKNAEEALHLAHKKAEKANIAKSKFLAAASHDLRQPIQAMGFFISTLKFTALDGESQGIISDLSDCLNATNDLLNALLEISRLDAGVLEPHISSFPISELFDQLEVEFASMADTKKIEFRVVPCKAIVRSDSLLLERILRNLVSNALQHTNSGRVLLGCRRRGHELEIQVWDTGEGIPDNAIDKVFDEFFQVGNPQRDRRKGLGLGLAIVKRVAGLLDNPISLSSRLGKGSMFSLRVPMTKEAYLHRPVGRETNEINIAGAKIMIIEDDPVQLKALAGLFSRWGCRSFVAESIEDATSLLGETKEIPDIILSDYRLHDGVVGADVILRLQNLLGKPVPGLILTGDTEPARIREAQQSGFVLVHKPVVAEHLKTTIEKILSETTGSFAASHSDTRPPGENTTSSVKTR